MLVYELIENGEEKKLVFDGRVDNEGTKIFQNGLDEILVKNFSKISLDFSKITFINSSGIGKLLLFYKKFKNKGGELVISGINDDVYALFKAILLDKLIKIEK
jgi:anti-anti-sigma factor